MLGKGSGNDREGQFGLTCKSLLVSKVTSSLSSLVLWIFLLQYFPALISMRNTVNSNMVKCVKCTQENCALTGS